MEDESAVAQANFVRKQIAVSSVLVSLLIIPGWRLERILRNACVVQMHASIMKRSEQYEFYFKLANLVSFSGRNLIHNETFKPCVVKRTGRFEVEISRIRRKCVNVVRQACSYGEDVFLVAGIVDSSGFLVNVLHVEETYFRSRMLAINENDDFGRHARLTA